jgi:NitT/TauT family transport system substrate-binding protein
MAGKRRFEVTRRRLLAGAAGTVALVGAGAVATFRRAAVQRETLVVADGRQLSSALFYIALIQGYFAEQGLEVQVQSHSFSRRAMEALMAGKAELAMSSEVPIMHALADGHALKVVANLQTSDRDMAILARRDRAIAGPADLAGKQVGYIARTNGHVFLDQFLAAHGLSAKVTTVAFAPEQLVPALVTGAVDAVSSWASIRLAAASQLPESVVLTAPNVYLECWGLAAAAAVAERKRGALEKFLRGLLRAEQLVADDSERAVGLVAQYLGQGRPEVAALWPQFDFAVNLNQTFIINLENAARTERREDADPSKLDYALAIDPTALRAVDPRRVTLLQ